MMSLEKIESMIAVGEKEIKDQEEDANIDLLHLDTAYIIQLSMLKTLKYVRDFND